MYWGLTMHQAPYLCCLIYSVPQTYYLKRRKLKNKVIQVLSGAGKIQTLRQRECRARTVNHWQFGYAELEHLWPVTLSCPGGHADLDGV